MLAAGRGGGIPPASGGGAERGYEPGGMTAGFIDERRAIAGAAAGAGARSVVPAGMCMWRARPAPCWNMSQPAGALTGTTRVSGIAF